MIEHTTHIDIKSGGREQGKMINGYSVAKAIGNFSDENSFKKEYMSIIERNTDKYKTVFAIENQVEPGMPDLIVIDIKGRSVFVETKYARKGVITFKRTQIPWYRRNKNLPIFILAYNDLTRNIHVIDGDYICRKADGLSFKLYNEDAFKLEGLV